MVCEFCRYWVERKPQKAMDGKRQGYCHFNPPRVGGAMPFPPVPHDEFCGRLKPRKEKR